MVSLTSDPRAEAGSRGLTLDPATHLLMPDGLFLSSIKRASRRRDLFLYFHRHTRRFVIAAWLYSPSSHSPRIALELETLDWHPDLGVLGFQEFLQRLRLTYSSQVRHMRTKILAQRARVAEDRAADLEQRNTVTRYLRNKGFALEAHLITTGQLPWVGLRAGGESLELTKERLKDMAYTQNRITRSLS